MAESFWTTCGKRGCGKRVKSAPNRLDPASGKFFHLDCLPRRVDRDAVAAAAPTVPGYRQVKHGYSPEEAEHDREAREEARQAEREARKEAEKK